MKLAWESTRAHLAGDCSFMEVQGRQINGGAGAGWGIGGCKIQMGCEFEATGEEGDVLRGGTGAHCVTYRCDLSVVGVARQMERSNTDSQRNMPMILLSILHECSLLRSDCGESDRNAGTLARGSKPRPIELNGSFQESSHNRISPDRAQSRRPSWDWIGSISPLCKDECAFAKAPYLVLVSDWNIVPVSSLYTECTCISYADSSLGLNQGTSITNFPLLFSHICTPISSSASSSSISLPFFGRCLIIFPVKAVFFFCSEACDSSFCTVWRIGLLSEFRALLFAFIDLRE